jgi:predicted MPP superfamily phosphohydrolase
MVGLRARILVFVLTVQSILFLGHWFVYATWTWFLGVADPFGKTGLGVALALLSVSFVTASLLGHRYSNLPVSIFYRIAATWLGFLNFLFLAACACWMVYGSAAVVGLHLARPAVAEMLFGLAIFAGLCGILKARWVRVRRITIRLPNLPQSWRGRMAALVTDTHLGHINGSRFMRRIVAMLGRLGPDVVFISGDLYDGSKVDYRRLVEPWKSLTSRFGAYFVTGNHEEFSDRGKYLDAVRGSGVRVLNNEKVTLDGLQVVGVHYSDSSNPERYQKILEHAAVDRNHASILLTHVPHALPIAEKAGISLQLSGHTHGGQLFPFTWFTSRIFGAYTYGLRRFRELMVYTSTGAGTWGPPMRLGAPPEIVLFTFE